MTRESLIKMGLTEEQADAVMAGLDGNFVIKSRFNEVNTELAQAKTELKSRDKQLEELKKAGGDTEALTARITELQQANKTASEAHAAEMKHTRLHAAADRALMGAKARNITAAKALLSGFLEKAEMDGDTVVGLDDAVKALVKGEDSKFLFGAPPPVPGPGNPPPAPPNPGTQSIFEKVGTITLKE